MLPLSSKAGAHNDSGSDSREQEDQEKLLPHESHVSSTTLSEQDASSAGCRVSLDGVEPPQAGSWDSAHLLYLAHFLARWAWRAWEFAVALILMQLYPGSLLLVSIYGMLDNVVRLLLGSAVGNYIDRTDRLQGACKSILLQNACIAASAGAGGVMVVCMHLFHMQLHGMVYWVLLCIVMGGGALSSVGSTGATVSIEKEWTKTMCGADAAALGRLNAGLRAIDLICQMLGPMFSGLLMTYAGMWVAMAVIGCYCLAMWLPEVLLLKAVYARSALLRAPKTAQQSSGRRRWLLKALVAGWHTYFAQSTVLAALALALLYLTVLSLGLLMTGYVKHLGMSEAALSVFRATGALSGLAAAAIFPPLQRAFGLKAAGCVGISWQLLCLLGGTAPAVLASLGLLQLDGQLVSGVLLGGLVASRCGLWLFDLAVCQLQQDYVEPGQLGAVTGVQTSVQSLFEITSFVAGCILHAPEQFHWLMLGSLASVCTAAGLFFVFVYMSAAQRHSQPYQLVGSTA